MIFGIWYLHIFNVADSLTFTLWQMEAARAFVWAATWLDGQWCIDANTFLEIWRGEKVVEINFLYCQSRIFKELGKLVGFLCEIAANYVKKMVFVMHLVLVVWNNSWEWNNRCWAICKFGMTWLGGNSISTFLPTWCKKNIIMIYSGTIDCCQVLLVKKQYYDAGWVQKKIVKCPARGKHRQRKKHTAFTALQLWRHSMV